MLLACCCAWLLPAVCARFSMSLHRIAIHLLPSSGRSLHACMCGRCQVRCRCACHLSGAPAPRQRTDWAGRLDPPCPDLSGLAAPQSKAHALLSPASAFLGEAGWGWWGLEGSNRFFCRQPLAEESIRVATSTPFFADCLPLALTMSLAISSCCWWLLHSFPLSSLVPSLNCI